MSDFYSIKTVHHIDSELLRTREQWIVTDYRDPDTSYSFESEYDALTWIRYQCGITMTHAQQRAKERFDLDLEFWQLGVILKKIKRGEAALVGQDKDSKQFMVRYMGKNLRIVTNLKQTGVLTILRPGMR